MKKDIRIVDNLYKIAVLVFLIVFLITFDKFLIEYTTYNKKHLKTLKNNTLLEKKLNDNLEILINDTNEVE